MADVRRAEEVAAMMHDDFITLANARFAACSKILAAKSQEYSRADDKLHNFKRAGEVLHVAPERALIGMKAKHDVSILDIVDDLTMGGHLPDEALLSEKIADSINYLVLLEALITERLHDGC